ncbi:MAG: SH3 domain-containing protein [Lachnospiraceae bacterium]|nr:SH3 domain-containing protein [Lachnospiraceae bacterium]
MKKEKQLRDHISVKESVASVRSGLVDILILIKEWITDYGRVILPIILLICIGATALISLTARSKVLAAEKEAEEALQESKTEVAEVMEIEFEVDKYPEINDMFVRYYDALGNADIEALEAIQGTVSETESLRLQAMGPYIDRYDNVCVYTKPGPYQDTYIAYVSVDVYLKETNVSTPGLQGFYVCKNEEGEFYINTAELSSEESAYISNVILQADVIDLQNTVNVQYTELMDENEELKEYWAQISVEIDSSVGETLTEEAVALAKLEEEEEAKRLAEEQNDPDYYANHPEENKILRVKTTERVNVRKSASVTADRVGTASEGAVYLALEVMNNGWTKIDFDGTEAYIKSEYLTEVEDASNYETASYIIAISALNVRSSPSATAEKLGILSEGDTAELIEEKDGWSKIKYNGSVAYVKTEFTEKK